MTTTDKIEPIHPGEVLMEDFIEGFGITQNKLAVSIGVPPRRINEIVHGKRGITADTALRLAKYFGTSAEFWINLQSHYELDRAEEQIDAIVPLGAGRFLSPAGQPEVGGCVSDFVAYAPSVRSVTSGAAVEIKAATPS